MDFNFISILVAALSTMVVGFVWYNPKVFGTIWMRESGITEDDAKKGNMVKIFGFTIFFSVLISFSLSGMVIHQFGALGMIGGPNEIPNALPSYNAFMADYGDHFRTYKHGALHGFIVGLLFIFPIMGVNAMFNQTSWKLLFVTAGY